MKKLVVFDFDGVIADSLHAAYTTWLQAGATLSRDKHNLSKYFAAILGNDIATSKITKFNMILERCQILPSNCVMVTDTLGDLREAHAANFHTIAVTWGFHDRATLTRGNPAAIIEYLITTVPAIFKVR